MNTIARNNAEPAVRTSADGSHTAASGQFATADDGIDLRALLMPLWRRKRILIACILVALAGGIFAALKMDNRYTAAARVIFEPERLRIIDLGSVIATSDDAAVQMRNQIEILRSATLLERVIDSLVLERTPEFNPALRPRPDALLESALTRVPWPTTVAQQLAKLGMLPHPELEGISEEEKALRLRGTIVATLAGNMQLRPVPNSRVIEIAYRSTDPGLSAAIVNTAAEQYIVVQTERKRDDVAQATELLGTRVADLEGRLDAAEEAVRLARLELSMGGQHGSGIIAAQIETLNASLAATRGERTALEARIAQATLALRSSDDLHSNPDFRASPIISGFQVREAELRDQEAATRSIVANRTNPSLVRLDARLAEVQRNVEAEATRIIAGLENQVAAAEAREALLQEELGELEQRAAEQSRAEMRLAQLEREADARRSIYENFLHRMNQTSEQAALQSPDARFLTRAIAPVAPDNRLRKIVVAAATFAGLALGIGIIFLLERFNDTFRSSTEIEARTGLAVFAGIPRIGGQSGPRELLAGVLAEPASALAESTRNLRTSILFSNIDQAPKVVMFVSSLSGEGKTTTAMLTAITSQQMERSAVIVDCDLRRRAVSSIFPIDPEQPGLFSALQGASSIENAVYVEPETGLHVLAPERAGHGLGNPADILASRRFQRLIAQLRARYDLVILDTPPALAVADVRIMAQYADAVVYLVRWNATRRQAVVEGLRELRSVNAKIAGITLTLVDEKQASGYFAGEYLYKQSYGT